MSDLLEDKTGKKNIYEKRDAERITNILIENQDMHDLFYIFEKMSPEKIKALLTLCLIAKVNSSAEVNSTALSNLSSFSTF